MIGVPAPRFPEPPKDWVKDFMQEYTRVLVLWINRLVSETAEEQAFKATVTVTTTYDILQTDNLILADAAGGNFDVRLPDPAVTVGRRFTVKRINSGGNKPTVVPFASETIDGASSKTFTNRWDAYTFRSDGTNWHIISGYV